MWGTYETSEGTIGTINVDFGHSKDKRQDKKQIKYGIGCANGLIVDAIVLSGNKDDKTYNSDTIKRLDVKLSNLKVDKKNFYYYIADSALFLRDNLNLSKERKIKLITRMPDNTLIAKETIKEAVDKEAETINKIAKTFAKRKFVCKEDACLEILKLKPKDLKR